MAFPGFPSLRRLHLPSPARPSHPPPCTAEGGAGIALALTHSTRLLPCAASKGRRPVGGPLDQAQPSSRPLIDSPADV